MKKLNTTYLENLVSKILNETLEERADNLVSKIKTSMDEKESNICECGGMMYEGECSECGEGISDVSKKFPKSQSFDYIEEEEGDGESDGNYDYDEEACKWHKENNAPKDRIEKFCGTEVNESLKGNQKVLDKNKNNRLDTEDFKMLRKSKKSEMGESLKGNQRVLDKNKNNRLDTEDFKMLRRNKKLEMGESDEKSIPKETKEFKKKSGEQKESVKLTENQMIELIEKVIMEQSKEKNIKSMGTPKGLDKQIQVHKKSGKENDDYLKSVTKKMTEYLKDGSKGEYSTEPKIFPKGNGELSKMSKKAYIPSGAVEEYTDNLTAAGQENLVYDEINPNEEWITDNIEGSSRTGNNPEWANTGESDVNKKRNTIRKKNILGQIKKKAYNKAPQPTVNDNAGEDEGSKLMAKLESLEPKQSKQISEEFDRMKSLITYKGKTQ
jgi:hypothetical protein